MKMTMTMPTTLPTLPIPAMGNLPTLPTLATLKLFMEGSPQTGYHHHLHPQTRETGLDKPRHQHLSLLPLPCLILLQVQVVIMTSVTVSIFTPGRTENTIFIPKGSSLAWITGRTPSTRKVRESWRQRTAPEAGDGAEASQCPQHHVDPDFAPDTDYQAWYPLHSSLRLQQPALYHPNRCQHVEGIFLLEN